MARALLGAGARSVVIALQAIGDEGTLEFKSFFYNALAKGKKVSEALKQAMKCMREIEKFMQVIQPGFEGYLEAEASKHSVQTFIQYKVTLNHNYSFYMSTDTCVLLSFQLGYEFIFSSDKSLRCNTIKWTRLR